VISVAAPKAGIKKRNEAKGDKSLTKFKTTHGTCIFKKGAAAISRMHNYGQNFLLP
jgi:hypothetical protein